MKVIGVAAQLGMGKNVLCDYLAKQLNELEPPTFCGCSVPFWERSAFANAVKDVFESSFGVDREFTEKWKRNPDSPPGMLQNVRKSLQFIGDGFRKIRDEIWIEIALRDESRKLIISDSRYINEAKAVKAKGGCMVALYRPGFLNDDPNPSESQIRPVIEWLAHHENEGPIKHETHNNAPESIQYYDYFLINEGSVQDLYNKVDNLLIPWIQYNL